MNKSLMNIALLQAESSYCSRAKVGAVISRDNRIISTGYNGTPTKYNNNCEEFINNSLKTKREVIHAEANAILHCAKMGISVNDCSIYITLFPCFECSKMIIQSGIKEVIYMRDYKGNSSLNFLLENNIEVKKYK